MLDVEKIQKTKHITEIYCFDIEKPDKRIKTFSLNPSKKEIFFYPQGIFIEKIKITGFDTLPKEFNEKGYIKGGLVYYLHKKFQEKKILSLEISKSEKSEIIKKGDNYSVVINYQDFALICKKVSAIIYESKVEKSDYIDDSFHTIFPEEFKEQRESWRTGARKVISNLDQRIIPYISNEENKILVNFFEDFIKKRYKSEDSKHKLFSFAKIKIDDIAIDQIISELSNLIQKKSSEAELGELLKKNLFLIDSKYIKVISEINLMLAGARKVDFGLIDSQGYMDIFEIKKPSTTLLAKTKDRGNYYWSTEAIKAIVQAEKYLHNAERKASILTEDMRREKDVSVEVIKPRAFVILGSKLQLNNKQKKEDFQILRRSLKNIEIILYDELLERIQNQKNKIYTE
jgi:hypothetical protein